jgi:CelD/BcsL family acetyltransferase involved in cellulose biosynthesis
MQYTQSSPFIRINTDWDTYWESRSWNDRRKIKKHTRSLGKLGNLRYELFSGTDSLDCLLDSVFQVAAKGWAAKEGSAINSTPQLKGFYADLVRMADRQGWLKCHLLFLESKPIAFDLCLLYNNVAYDLKIGFDEEFSRYSPGELLRSFVLQGIFSAGVSEFDFLGDSMPWKYRWANGVREHLKLFVFNSTVHARWLHWLPLELKEKIKTQLHMNREPYAAKPENAVSGGLYNA